MQLKIIKAWENNKHRLENHFKEMKGTENLSYGEIVRLLFEKVITDIESDDTWGDLNFNLSQLIELDHGSYQGTQIWIVPLDRYQPDVTDYVYTHNYYGSCSGCDTLQSILSNHDYIEDEDEFTFTEKQIRDLMTLALHLVQNMKFLVG